ncbi:MAG TPA: right-handed parallel beta-helix repeat-containing protein [Candidatus Dependentiae bacterium]|nr:right-handed parallel beta-helix repeat-containing protein [Candidatus Dependentiae bacterium]HRQ62694.1 right-handed parallel beta-helix repeat-containing protein [Candidatus Dependentiae bacterium]
MKHINKILLFLLCMVSPLIANIVLDNCSFLNSSKGFEIESLSDVLLINCIASGNETDGFDFIATNSILMCDSFAHSNQGAGIHFDASCFAIDVFDTISEQNTGGDLVDDTSSAFQVSNKIIQSKVCEIEVDLASDTDAILSAIDEIDFNVIISVTLTGEAVSGCDYLITASQIPYIANRPGVHCLVENIQGGFVGAAAITITSSCVTLDMMDRFIDGEGTSLIGINVGGANDVTIKDGTIKNVTDTGIFIGTGASGKERITVSNVNIASAGASGVAISSGANIVLEGCNIYNCAANGMLIFGSAADLVIRACIASQNAADGFLVSSSSVNNCIFENTIAGNNGADGFDIRGNNCQIANCTSVSNASAGIRAATGTSAQTLEVCNNLVHNNGINLVNTIDGNLCKMGCDFIIQQNDIPYTITVPGNYCLAESITVGASNGIIVAADDVTLDLKNKIIEGSGTDMALVISGTNVYVKDGLITNFNNGISVESDAGFVLIENMIVNDCETSGIIVSNIETNVNNCSVSGGGLFGGIVGRMQEVNDCTIQNIIATGLGIGSGAVSPVARNCTIQNIGGTGVAIAVNNATVVNTIVSNANLGFDVVTNNNTIENCTACDTSSHGFYVEGNDNIVVDSISNNSGLDGFHAEGNNVTFRECCAVDSARHGFQVLDGSRYVISYCESINSGIDGFNIDPTNVATVSNCTETDSGRYSYYLGETNPLVATESLLPPGSYQMTGTRGIHLFDNIANPSVDVGTGTTARNDAYNFEFLFTPFVGPVTSQRARRLSSTLGVQTNGQGNIDESFGSVPGGFIAAAADIAVFNSRSNASP